MERQLMANEKSRLADERKALDTQRQRLAAEREAFEAERARLDDTERKKSERLTKLELKCQSQKHRLLDLEQRAQLAEAKAALPSLVTKCSQRGGKDLQKSAMEKAALVGKKLGRVIFEQLLDQSLDQMEACDAKSFRMKLASGELLDIASTCVFPPEPQHKNCETHGGQPYFKPAGWVRCGLITAGSAVADTADWCIAYHGTSTRNALRILVHGLQRPGENGVSVNHGQAHSTTGHSIYASPSIEYAAFPCYAELHQVGEQHWAQLVLECRVRPDTFKKASGTLGSNKHWPHDVPIDTNYPALDGLEWLIEDPNDVVVTSVMIREFGGHVDASIYGDLAREVKGPEYVWTDLRVNSLRKRIDA
jgi:hypothetical protein